nr:MAG TPA: hypothetical protein [Caudoviricetes sp.]
MNIIKRKSFSYFQLFLIPLSLSKRLFFCLILYLFK